MKKSCALARKYPYHIIYIPLILISLILTMAVVSRWCTSISIASNLEGGIEERYQYYTCYTIQSGDTLRSIASTYITQEYPSIDSYVKEICVMNKIENPNEIRIGYTLILPYYTEV